jgi:hypothetical protein
VGADLGDSGDRQFAYDGSDGLLGEAHQGGEFRDGTSRWGKPPDDFQMPDPDVTQALNGQLRGKIRIPGGNCGGETGSQVSDKYFS